MYLFAQQNHFLATCHAARRIAQLADDQIGHSLFVENRIGNDGRQWNGETAARLTLEKHLEAETHRVEIDAGRLVAVGEPG